MDQLANLSMMLAKRYGSGLAGFAVASMIIWYLFPIVPALSSPVLRIAAIAVMLVVCIGLTVVLRWRKKRREKALATAMTGEGGRGERDTEAEANEEVARLRERMKQVLGRLRKQGRGTQLYEQPWFVMIGPPGSGKTTALLNSGLKFPLARDGEDPQVGGVGGTRLCDWWFADEAVLIDTAGRYTTQDSNKAIDRAGWQGFLQLLRRSRPRQPINGVIVVLSLLDLVTADTTERKAHAQLVRRRIDEITEQLRLRVPVYLVLSKSDQLRGFDAYFDDLDATGRAQVWGMTFPLDGTADDFSREFRLLINRLQDRLVERLQAERAAERRGLIGGFPLQVASLEQPLTEFLRAAFVGTRLDPAPFLRGVYLTSATQAGTPIDRLTGLLARSFGLEQRKLPSLRPVRGRSYFIDRLLRDVVLGEAMLVSRDPSAMRRRRILRIAGFSAIGLATLVAGLLLWRADTANRIAIEQADEHLATFRQALGSIAVDPIADDDLPKVVPLLDAASAVSHDSGGWGPFGLSQAAKLAQSNRLVYAHALQRVFLPRLIWRLEQQMHAHFSDPEFLYEATRVYLMLGSAGPVDPDLVRAWMTDDWQACYGGNLNGALRARLLVHLNALLAAPLPTITLDGALVEAARATFSRVTPAARVYSRLRADASAAAVPDWRPADSLGEIGARLFVRPSGHPLTDGVPGFLTGAGYQAMLHDLLTTTRKVAEESWVLGHEQQIPTDGPPVVALEKSVIELYVADAQKQWDALLGDLALAAFGGHDPTIQTLYVLSAPQSPMRDLLKSIASALQFRTPAPAATNGGKDKLASLFTPSANAAQAPDTAIDGLQSHFQPLLNLVGSGSSTPLDGVLRLVNGLQQQLASLGPNSTTLPPAPAGGNPIQLLLAEADRQPLPVSRWLRQIASVGNTALGTAVQQAASSAFAGNDGPATLCHSVVDGHYPFASTSAPDASLSDFAKLFAPGGQLDAYFQSQLKPFVDSRGPVWTVHPVGDISAPVDRSSISSFQRVETIRDAMFTAGQPQFRFTLTPVADSAKATLKLGGASLSTDVNQATPFVWPGADGMIDVSLRADRKVSTGKADHNAQHGIASAEAPDDGLHASGTWALFKLFAQAKMSSAGQPGSVRLEFETSGIHAGFMLQTESGKNPFSGLLGGFRCPTIY